MFALIIRLVVFTSFLIFVVWIVGGLYLDGMIKRGIERFGPQITGTTVSLDGAHFSFVTGHGRLQNLVVGNPKGYHMPNAYRVPEARVTFDPASVMSGKLMIDEIVIDRPEITYEVTFSDDNLETIHRNARAFSREHGLNVRTRSEKKKRLAPGTLVTINHFILKDAKLKVSATIFRGRSLTFDMDDMHLYDIGKDSQGMTMDMVTSYVLSETTDSVQKIVDKSSKVHMKRGKRTVEADTSGSGAAGTGTSGGGKDVSDSFGKAWTAVKNFLGDGWKGEKPSPTD